MANDKSIFKKLACPVCKTWESDPTGKTRTQCPKCGSERSHSVKWYCRLTRDGKTTTKAISSRRQEAVDYLHAAKDAVRRGALLPGEEKGITWNNAVKDFKNWVAGGSLGEGTQEFYLGHLKHLNDYFDCDLQDITIKQVEQFRDMRLKSAAPKTVAENIKTLKRIYALQCRWHSARVAPSLHAVAADLSMVEMPKYNNKRTRYLSPDETALLIDKATTPHLRLAIKIALGTGLRLANIMGLEWKQIDFIGRSITYQGDDMKSRRVFVSPLMSNIVVDLVAWRKSQKIISPFVFPSPNLPKQHMENMRTSWEATLAECNFSDVVFHTLRHTFASHFLMSGGDLATLSELLDHASIQITKDRYGHLSGEHKRNAVDAFEAVFFPSIPDRIIA